MRVQIKREDEDQKIVYPCLMESKDSQSIVLFSGEGHGTIIVAGEWNDSSCGEFDIDWDMDRFIPFEGNLILSNE